MKASMKILYLEDDPCDVELTQAALKGAGIHFEIKAVSTKRDFEAALHEAPVDLILSDNSVPGFDGASALRLVRAELGEMPFIFLSGNADTDQVPNRQAGERSSARIPKSNLTQLAPAILRLTSGKTDEPAAVPSEWYVRAMERLVEVVQDLSLARDLPRIMEIVRKAARELTNADGATFVLRDGDKCHYVDENAIAPLWKGRRFPMSACISGWSMLNRQPAIIGDIYADPRVPTDAYRPTFVKSLVMVPIRTVEPVGAIGNYWAVQRQPRPEEVRLLQALADSTSVAMENVQLYSGLEQKVKDRTARLEAANQGLESFSYSVSHDLRAPLRHISGYIGMLHSDPANTLSTESQRYVGLVSNSARRMGQLIDDLLDFSRLGRMELRHARVNMNDLANEVLHELQSDTANRNISWQFDDLPDVEGDRSLLKQVWVNLLSNAVKYTGKRERAEIRVAASLVNDEWQFSVQDNGSGFDNNHAGQLFGVFQRLHGADEFEGTGVGLANVRQIVTRHGGRTWADGRVNEGATFYFTLPAAKAQP